MTNDDHETGGQAPDEDQAAGRSEGRGTSEGRPGTATAAPSPASGPEEAAERERLAMELRLRTERVRILTQELRDTRTDLRRVRSDLRTLRRRRAVRLALALTRVLQPMARAARRISETWRHAPWSGRRPSSPPRRRIRATAAEDAELRARLAQALVPSGRTTGPLVSAVILTRDGIDHLRRLLPALDELAYRDLELVLVDNASSDGTIAWLEAHPPRRPMHLIRNRVNHSFSDANNQGVAQARGELILLLNNDAVPAGPHVVGHMVDLMLRDPGVVAVGSRLIYPRRPGPEMGGPGASVDLTLQHRGVAFEVESGVPIARNLGRGEDPLGREAGMARDVALATGAALLVRRSSLAAVGGLPADYDYGQEDTDLCLRLRAAGGRIAYEPQATFWHHESATQHREAAAVRRERHMANRRLLAERWGPRIAREVLLDMLEGRGTWSARPLHVAITVTRADPAAGFGDWYTAHELGDALEAHGWRVTYLERWHDGWHEPDPTVDVVVALLDALDVRRLPEGIVKVAWVRNWTERWIQHPWFDEYDIVLASSRRSKELIDAGSVHVAELMPLATNPARFRPPAQPAEPVADALFSANRWNEPRSLETVAPRIAEAGHSVIVHGKGWQASPSVADLARGELAYDDLPAAYAGANLVIDDSASSTLPYGAINSRVFDALATGTLVVTDNVAGAAELFGDQLPAAPDAESLVQLADRWLADPVARRERSEALRALVLERHTYARRAEELREILVRWAVQPRVDIAIGPPSWDGARHWGDYHFGRALQRGLRRRGIRGHLRLRSAWDAPEAAYADAVIHLFGLAACPTRSGQLSVLWIISHPDLVTEEMLESYDIVFAASDRFAAALSERTGIAVVPLHQATDPDRFRPTPGGPVHDLLFVANSRGVRRAILDALLPTDHDLAVYGRGWKPELLEPRHVSGEHVPNHELPAYYSAARIVLNDHWADMAAQGFLSNRLYDAAACGAFVMSDRIAEIDAEFDGGVATYVDREHLHALLDRALADPGWRATCGDRARAAVLARHTFAHRTDELLRVIGPALDSRPSRIVPASR